MKGNNTLAYVQADARSTLAEYRIDHFVLCLEKTVENLRKVFFRNTTPCIGHGQIKLYLPLLVHQSGRIQADGSAVGRKLHRISQKIRQYPVKILRVGTDRKSLQVIISLQGNMAVFHKSNERQQQIFYHGHQIERMHIQLHLFRIEFPEIHQFIHQRKQILHIPFGDLQLLFHLLIGSERQSLLNGAVDERDRRTELMGDVRKETDFFLGHFFHMMRHDLQAVILYLQFVCTLCHQLFQNNLPAFQPTYLITIKENGKRTCGQKNQRPEPPRLIIIRTYLQVQPQHLLLPFSLLISGLYFQPTVSRRKRGQYHHWILYRKFRPFSTVFLHSVTDTDRLIVAIFMRRQSQFQFVSLLQAVYTFPGPILPFSVIDTA